MTGYLGSQKYWKCYGHADWGLETLDIAIGKWYITDRGKIGLHSASWPLVLAVGDLLICLCPLQGIIRIEAGRLFHLREASSWPILSLRIPQLPAYSSLVMKKVRRAYTPYRNLQEIGMPLKKIIQYAKDQFAKYGTNRRVYDRW